ncbi:hypothetical protein ACIPY2_08470 [Paenarthrobacter sp. NPDC089675]|uniref:hypothetical protein n=1 Tax=Paenarthrobacter sp. NPDC089675 TaxID=3364376 RepID=UPI00380A2200
MSIIQNSPVPEDTPYVQEGLTGLLRAGAEYVHCGEPMAFATSSARSIYTPITTEDEGDPLMDVYLETRVLQCACGFRMELPA